MRVRNYRVFISRARSSVRLERLPCKQEASGSNPDGSIPFKEYVPVIGNTKSRLLWFGKSSKIKGFSAVAWLDMKYNQEKTKTKIHIDEPFAS